MKVNLSFWTVLAAFVILFGFWHNINYKFESFIISSVLNLLVLVTVVLVFKQPQIIEILKIQKSKYIKSTLNDKEKQDIENKIMATSEKSEVITNPEITLEQFAKLINYSPQKVSQVINEKSGLNFNSFINQKRVEYACDLIAKDPDVKILAIVYDSGFNNKNSFYMAFKKFKGVTPSVYASRYKNLGKEVSEYKL
ncbi:MAG: AraC family transcriptional regulator [Saprospiraceae bacterium]|nr:AraC family transcriptional regulator [Saprospiraceae bacterium]